MKSTPGHELKRNTPNDVSGKTRWTLGLAAVLLFAAAQVKGQLFTNVLGTGLPQLSTGSAAWGDFDNDGKLDLLLVGYNGSSNVCQVWQNNGNGTFNLSTNIAGPANGTVAWGDYDNDGYIDFVFIGQIGTNRVTQIWHNNGNGTFTRNTNAVITGVAFGAVAWGDYDNDGKLDLVLCGYTGTQYVCQLWHNNGDGTFTQNTNTAFPPLRDGALAWGDYNNDGYQDLLLAGQSNGVAICQIWQNLGNGSFSNINAGLTGVWRATVAWGDYDNDGNLDVLLAGGTTNNPGNGGPTNPVCQVWHNQGGGVFTNLNVVGLPGVMSGSVAWGDYNHDGMPDILVCGATNDATGAAVSQLWNNTGTTFTNSGLALTGVYGGAMAWGAISNDGRMDFALMGYNTSSGALCQVWDNQTSLSNSPPVSPNGFSVSNITANSAWPNWSYAVDDVTPIAGLNYNVRVGTAPGGSDVVNPQANVTNGFRRLPALGNAGERYFFILTNLTPGVTYYWSAQAVDTSFAGGPFGTEATFATPAAAPSIVSATTLNPGSTNISLEAVVLPNAAATGVQFLYGTDTNYTGSTPFTGIGAGHTAVSVTNLITSLFNNFTYHFAVVATNSVGSVISQDYTFTLPVISNITVTTTADAGPGSLRQAILDAAPGGTITISATGTNTLASPLPVIFKALTINGPGTNNLTISGANAYRVFFVDASNSAVNFNNFTIANGNAQGGNGGDGELAGGAGMGAGGGLFVNAGQVLVSNIVFSGNAAAGGNGGNFNGTYNGGGGGGGGLGGNGGHGYNFAGGGGGGFGGNGGSVNSNDGGGGGGGGIDGNGGDAYSGTTFFGGGGGGGAITAGQSATNGNGGLGGDGYGGTGGTGTSSHNATPGQSGALFGGGGGAGYTMANGDGGAGGKFGGAGGSFGAGHGNNGGDFGGGGGALPPSGETGGPGGGGFGGGGGGGHGADRGSGGGGFGGGSGAAFSAGARGNPGAFAGLSGYDVSGAAGGGGAALGGAIFVRPDSGGALTFADSSTDSGTLTPGAAGTMPNGTPSAELASPGQASGSAMFLLGGTNTFFISGSKTISGSISGWSGTTSTMIKSGGGTLVLSASNTFPGIILINAGTLRIDGSSSASSNVVNNGGTIAGTGAVGPLAVLAGGTLSPGDSPGTLTAGNSVWSGAGNYNWQLYDATNTAGVGYDSLQVNGTLDVSAASGFNINLWTLSSLAPDVNGLAINFSPSNSYTWTLVQTTGGIVGFNPANFVIQTNAHNGAGGFANTNSGHFSFSVTNNSLVLSYAPSLSVVQPVLSVPTLSNGIAQFSFSNVPGASFTMFSTTNLAFPLSNWTLLGPVSETPPGQYHFTDSGATNQPAKFYRMRSP